jgi:luciferase family oxidoreductase group 1
MSEPAVPFSVLDLAPIPQGATAADALRHSLDLARHAERWGYHRYWLAEHHNFPGIASAATSVVIGHVAAGTSRIRVGSGGIMLSNHAPLVIAEQFGTLESLYPGRIDLGLGRAPGTDQPTTHALRRDPVRGGDTFPQELEELRSYLAPSVPGQAVHAVPGEGLSIPIWLLGSSTFSAELAARLGLPFAFAWHFAPDALFDALEIYRSNFQPSATLSRPYAMLGVNVFAAETEAEAEHLFTSLQQAFLQHIRRGRQPLPPPVASMEGLWSRSEEAYVRHQLAGSVVGSSEKVARGLETVLEETGVDEIMVTAQIFDHAARLRSFEIVAGLRGLVPPVEDRSREGASTVASAACPA